MFAVHGAGVSQAAFLLHCCSGAVVLHSFPGGISIVGVELSLLGVTLKFQCLNSLECERVGLGSVGLCWWQGGRREESSLLLAVENITLNPLFLGE